jgi:Flp pilus assembly protein TadG
MSTSTDRGRAWARDERGTALAEFALVLPILLVVVLAILDAGKAFNYWIDSTHLANEAARYAAVHKSPVPGQSIEVAIRNQATTQELRNRMTVCIQTTGVVGDPVDVKVSSNYDWLYFLVGRSGIGPTSTLRGVASMRLEAAHVAGGGVYTKATSCP